MTGPRSGRDGPPDGRVSLWGAGLVCACVGHCAATALLAGTVVALGGGKLGALPFAVTAAAGGAAAMWVVRRRRARVVAEPSPGG